MVVTPPTTERLVAQKVSFKNFWENCEIFFFKKKKKKLPSFLSGRRKKKSFFF